MTEPAPRTSAEGVLITHDSDRTTTELGSGDTVYYHGIPKTVQSVLEPPRGPHEYMELTFQGAAGPIYAARKQVWRLATSPLQRVPYIHATTASVSRITLYSDPFSMAAPALRAAAIDTLNAYLRTIAPVSPQVCVWLSATEDPGQLDYYCGQLTSYTYAHDISCGVLIFADGTRLYDKHLVRITF